jgi:hypothetical protein
VVSGEQDVNAFSVSAPCTGHTCGRDRPAVARMRA